MGRVTSVTQNANSMTLTYDKLGLLVTKQDSEGNDTVYEYNYRGRLTKESDGEGTVVEYTYDYFGTLSTVTDGLGQTTGVLAVPTALPSTEGDTVRAVGARDGRDALAPQISLSGFITFSSFPASLYIAKGLE